MGFHHLHGYHMLDLIFMASSKSIYILYIHIYIRMSVYNDLRQQLGLEFMAFRQYFQRNSLTLDQKIASLTVDHEIDVSRNSFCFHKRKI